MGVKCDPVADSFYFSVKLDSIDDPSKRIVLSLIVKLYYPLRWLSPVELKAKLIMQELWLLKLEWDEKITLRFVGSMVGVLSGFDEFTSFENT